MEKMRQQLAAMVAEHGLSLVLSSLADAVLEENTEDLEEVNEAVEKLNDVAGQVEGIEWLAGAE